MGWGSETAKENRPDESIPAKWVAKYSASYKDS